MEISKDGNFRERMKILLLPAYSLEMLVFVAKKLCGGWLDDARSINLPNFGFQVSSKNDTGPVLYNNATNAIAYPWPSNPWA
jgi:hypothetical protein